MESRHDMYKNVHKGLRRALCTLLADAGSADHSEAVQAALATRWLQLAELLAAHHHHEDKFIGPHLQRLAPSLLVEMESVHDRLDDEVKGLCRVARELELAVASALPECARRFYRALGGFVGRYLEHMAQEEGRYLATLQAAYTDAELAAIEAELVASIAPALMERFLCAFLPAINPGERLTLLEDMRRHAPPEVFAGTCQLAAGVLVSADWQALHRGLSQHESAVARG
jgi:hypothetical protein